MKQLPKTPSQVYAEALRDAELEYREAQLALRSDDSDQARARYAKALAVYDSCRAPFPLCRLAPAT